MCSGSANENTWWKWRCLCEILDQLNKAANTNLNEQKLQILASEAGKILRLIFEWNLWELTGQEQSRLVREMKDYFRKFDSKHDERLIPQYVNIVSSLKVSAPGEFIRFIESYYSNEDTIIDPATIFTGRKGFWKLTDRWLIARSRVFDQSYYLKRYPDVRIADVPPLRHFIKYGSWECRSPNEDVDLIEFTRTNFDQIDTSVNPMVSYLRKTSK
jgi:hypothetical protein